MRFSQIFLTMGYNTVVNVYRVTSIKHARNRGYSQSTDRGRKQ